MRRRDTYREEAITSERKVEQRNAIRSIVGSRELNSQMLLWLMSLLFAFIAGPFAPMKTALVPNESTAAIYARDDLSDMNLTQYWDKVNLNERSAVEKYVFECGSLEISVVFGSHVPCRNRRVHNYDPW
eukprot:CAMPEP_0194028166 /NCGR_PEP_ID=MMETSP0009_2-20130614/2201_1 /TAXON_ID=210454 /ORGANISM="Grammatophora oceanica, Strain CCMP 410" /LENGTH=128 /DNA_ID=CAMNT_0038667469 /DNA_START=109 /DNA_END=492 /DNA_ORIENTATION=-